MGVKRIESSNGTYSKRDLKRIQKNADEQTARELMAKLAKSSDGDSRKEVRKDVMAELNAKYKNGGISKKQYKEAKKYNENGVKRLTKNIVGAEIESNETYRREAAGNRMEDYKTSESLGATDLNKKTLKKLEDANYDITAVRAAYEGKIGDDNEVTYSNSRKQPGEREEIKSGLYEADLKNRDLRRITRDVIGADYETAVDAGKVVRAATIGGGVGAATNAGLTTNVLQSSTTIVGDVTNITTQSATAAAGAVARGAGAGAAAGVAFSVTKQVLRTEDNLFQQREREDIKTFADFEAKIANKTVMKDKDARELSLEIARYYDTKDGFEYQQLLDDIKKAGGGSGSNLNLNEARALRDNLSTYGRTPANKTPEPEKKTKPEKQTPIVTPAPVDNKGTIEVTKEDIETTITISQNEHIVKKGENWFNLTQAKYGTKNYDDTMAIVRELQKLHPPKDGANIIDGYFVKKLYFPQEIETKYGTYDYNSEGKAKNLNSDPSSVRTITVNKPADKTTTSTSTEYTVSFGNFVRKVGSETDAQSTINTIKKANPETKFEVVW
ncbi:MAG: hypothetical protein R3Y28_05605 [Candidatus Gastranaerophilales bacterium]